MNAKPVDRLELEALLQRNRLHETIGAFKDKVGAARAKFDPTTNARAPLKRLAECFVHSFSSRLRLRRFVYPPSLKF